MWAKTDGKRGGWELDKSTTFKIFSEGECNQTQHGKPPIPHLRIRSHQPLRFGLHAHTFEQGNQRSQWEYNSGSQEPWNPTVGYLSKHILTLPYFRTHCRNKAYHSKPAVDPLRCRPTKCEHIPKFSAHLPQNSKTYIYSQVINPTGKVTMERSYPRTLHTLGAGGGGGGGIGWRDCESEGGCWGLVVTGGGRSIWPSCTMVTRSVVKIP